MAIIILTDSVAFAKARIAAIGYKAEDGRIVFVHNFESYLVATKYDCDTPWYEVYGACTKLEFDICHGMRSRFGEPSKNLMSLLEMLKTPLRLVSGGKTDGA